MLYPPHRWTQIRKQGKYAFAVFYGMVRAGAPIGFIFFFLAQFAPEIKLMPYAAESLAAAICFSLLYGSLFGVAVGLAAWRLNEREFKKWVPKDDKDDRRPPPPAKQTHYK